MPIPRPNRQIPTRRTIGRRIRSDDVPTYEYECEACGGNFEFFQSITASPKRKCPECGKLKLKRLISSGAGFLFKGDGFYITDYRSDDYKAKAKADGESSSKSTSSSSDSSSSSGDSSSKSSSSSGDSSSSGGGSGSSGGGDKSKS